MTTTYEPCIAGNPALNGICADPECQCHPHPVEPDHAREMIEHADHFSLLEPDELGTLYAWAAEDPTTTIQILDAVTNLRANAPEWNATMRLARHIEAFRGLSWPAYMDLLDVHRGLAHADCHYLDQHSGQGCDTDPIHELRLKRIARAMQLRIDLIRHLDLKA